MPIDNSITSFAFRALHLIAWCAGVWLFSGWLVSHANQANEYRQSIRSMAAQIDDITQRLNANKNLIKSEREQLFNTEQALREQTAVWTEINAQLKQQSRQIVQTARQLDKLKAALVDNSATLRHLINSRYRQGSKTQIKALLNHQNPYELGRLNHYHYYFSTAISDKSQQLNQQINQLKNLQHTAQVQQADYAAQQRIFQRQIQTLQETQQRRQQLIAKLDKKISTSNATLKQLKQDRARLGSLLEQINIQAAQLAKAQQQAQTSKRALVKGGFNKQKGRLNYPVDAKRSVLFGARLPVSGLSSNGVFFDTQPAQPVRSIFRGQVLFANALKGYGLLLIIDHGDNHISLYGHNKVIYKQVGDTVSTNEVVSQAGTSGGLQSPGLYFEIRNNTTPIDPAQWCQ